MRECCVTSADTKFREHFPAGPGIAGGSLGRYLLKIAQDWGPLTEAYAEAFTVRSVDEVALDHPALITKVECPNRHTTHLIVVNERLYYFVWRVNLICVSYWTLDKTLALVPKEQEENWPSHEHLIQLATALEIYFGRCTLSTEGLSQFNDIVFGAHGAAALLYSMTVDLAELFVFLHECSHEMRDPGFHPLIQLPRDFSDISPIRRNRWVTELEVDASATYLLLLSVGDTINRRYGLPMESAKKIGAILSFAGIDAALHTLLTLEKLRFGEATREHCITDSPWALHPPAVLRRNTFGLVSQAIAQKILQPAEWEEVKESVASMATVREHLFDSYLKGKEKEDG